MKITIYELLGLSRNRENEIYVKYHNRLTEQDDVMWACKENIVYKLDQNIVYLDDEVEILDEPKENFTGWKMYQDGKVVCSIEGLKKEDKIEELDIKRYVLTPYNKIAILDLQNKVNELIDKLNKEE